ncbi:hypothetical protein N658DRAFT_153643 [Parathielavia hyrcaniae]|uniref:Uncharacterized protein n=1 Tax=Parathielavia hyrcaniae TaxID=113614 RepID=A0AAN6PZZ9_9PEZI|nr:hypothetical protein N658DRAFT_153643 [Parathielavia hyrcaniae]
MQLTRICHICLTAAGKAPVKIIIHTLLPPECLHMCVAGAVGVFFLRPPSWLASHLLGCFTSYPSLSLHGMCS